MSLEPRLGSLERKLRRGEDDLAELRREVKLAWQSPDAGGGGGYCPITFNFTVTDSGTGSPLAGAVCAVLGSSGAAAGSATTDASGAAAVVVTGPDAYTYRVSDAGYTPAAGTLPSAGCNGSANQAVSLAAVAAVPCNFVVNGFAKAGGVPDQFATVTLHGGGVNNSGATTSSGFYQLVRSIVPGTAMTVNAFDNLGRHSQTINVTSICGTISLPDLVLV